jgi:hypothetical protein
MKNMLRVFGFLSEMAITLSDHLTITSMPGLSLSDHESHLSGYDLLGVKKLSHESSLAPPWPPPGLPPP